MNDQVRGIDAPLVSGWGAIENIRYKGFTQTSIDEFYRIILELQKTVDTSQLKNLRKQLEDHINDPHAHPINLQRLSEDILSSVYEQCQASGFTGTKDELLNLVLKDTSIIGTDNDSMAGISQEKGMNVIHWNQWMKDHSTTLSAHMVIRNLFIPYRCVTAIPTLHFDNWINSTTQVSLTDKWNRIGNSISFSINYPIAEPKVLFSISFPNRELRIEATPTEIIVLLDNEQIISIFHGGRLVPSKYLLIISPKKIVIRDNIKRETYIDTRPEQDLIIFPLMPTRVNFEHPVGSGVDLDHFTLYSRDFKEDEEEFFLH